MRAQATTFYEGPRTSTELHLLHLGGVESQMVLADTINWHTFKRSKLDPKLALNYFMSAHNIQTYLWLLGDDGSAGNDMRNYLDGLTFFYNKEVLSFNTLSLLALTNLTDTFTYLHLASVFYYIWTGNKMDLPLIHFSENVQYLPAGRFFISPFGPEYNLHNYFWIYKAPMQITFRAGQLENNFYSGIGVEGEFFRWQWLILGAQAELWKQPQLLGESYGSSQWGALLAFKPTVAPWDFMHFHGEFAFKTSGWVLGEPIKNGFIGRLGLSFFF